MPIPVPDEIVEATPENPTILDELVEELVRATRSDLTSPPIEGLDDWPVGSIGVSFTYETPAVATEQIFIESRGSCGYTGVCLARGGDALVPLVDPITSLSLVETCPDCMAQFCLRHRHARGLRYCGRHGRRHGRCVELAECPHCDTWNCDDHDQWECGQSNEEADNEEDDESYTDSGSYFTGRFREAELQFGGDEPVIGLAEGKRYAAIELEVENGDGRVSLPPEFGIEADGSLNSSGIEVTIPPSRMDALVTNITTACDSLVASGYEATARCGMHVHLDLRDKQRDHTFLSHLFAAFYSIEDVLFAMQHRNRHENHYSEPLRSRWQFYAVYGSKSRDFDFIYYNMRKSWQSMRQLSSQKSDKWGPRYNAVNFHSVYYRGSLEVRLHEGNLDARRALLWIELMQKIIARVESGIDYRLLRKLVQMDVTPAKVALISRLFSLGPVLKEEMRHRIISGQGWNFGIHYTMGAPTRKGLPGRVTRPSFRVTHRQCEWDGRTVPIASRCQSCGSMGRSRDVRGMMMDGSFIAEPDFAYQSF